MSELEDIAKKLRDGQDARPMSVRSFLALFNQERRGYKVVDRIRRELREFGLNSQPDFENENIDNPIQIVLAVDQMSGQDQVSSQTSAQAIGAIGEVSSDDLPYKEPREAVVTIRQGIPAAGKMPASIRPDEPVMKALSRLMDEKLSLLIVQKGDRARAEGVFSYESFSHSHMAGRQPNQVKDCMSRDFLEVNEEKPLIDAVKDIIRHGTVVVRSSQNQLCGVVTARDVTSVFVELAEPFLLLGQIENHLRALMERARLTKDEYKTLVIESDPTRRMKTEGPDDLTLGELITAFERDTYWKKVGLQFDKATFTNRLHSVRDIRNKVMHFSPDGLPPEDVESLKHARELLEKL